VCTHLYQFELRHKLVDSHAYEEEVVAIIQEEEPEGFGPQVPFMPSKKTKISKILGNADMMEVRGLITNTTLVMAGNLPSP